MTYARNDHIDDARARFQAWCKDLPYQQLDQIVHVVHEDGSTFILYNACLWESEPDLLCKPDNERKGYVGVCTEHNGDLFFPAADLFFWRADRATWAKSS